MSFKIKRKFSEGIEIGEFLVFVIEEKRGDVDGVAFRCDADEFHDLRQSEAAKHIQYGNVVFCNAIVYRDTVKIRDDVVRHTGICCKRDGLDFKSVIGTDHMTFPVNSFHISTEIFEADINLVVKIFINNENTVFSLTREAVIGDHAIFVTVFRNGILIDHRLPDLFKRLFEAVCDKIFLLNGEVLCGHFHRMRKRNLFFSDFI